MVLEQDDTWKKVDEFDRMFYGHYVGRWERVDVGLILPAIKPLTRSPSVLRKNKKST